MSKNKTLPVITIEEWLVEMESLERQVDSSDSVMTSAEIGAVLGLGLQAIRKRLRRWIQMGKVKSARKKVMGVDGILYWVPAYLILKDKQP